MQKLRVYIIMALVLVLGSCSNNDGSGSENETGKSTIPNGNAGISITENGELHIDADLYIFDRTTAKPAVIKADNTVNGTVEALITYGQEAQGEIKNGRFSITIPIPPDKYLVEAMTYTWAYPDLPDSFIKDGPDILVKNISYMIANIDGKEYFIDLMDNQKVHNYGSDYYLDGDYIEFLYSKGNVKIYGNREDKDEGLPEVWNINLIEGWNTICSFFSSSKYTTTSKSPSKSAKWVADFIDF